MVHMLAAPQLQRPRLVTSISNHIKWMDPCSLISLQNNSHSSDAQAPNRRRNDVSVKIMTAIELNTCNITVTDDILYTNIYNYDNNLKFIVLI